MPRSITTVSAGDEMKMGLGSSGWLSVACLRQDISKVKTARQDSVGHRPFLMQLISQLYKVMAQFSLWELSKSSVTKA